MSLQTPLFLRAKSGVSWSQNPVNIGFLGLAAVPYKAGQTTPDAVALLQQRPPVHEGVTIF
jgi:hypothetical protein